MAKKRKRHRRSAGATEYRETYNFWHEHICALDCLGLVSDEDLQKLNQLVQPRNIVPKRRKRGQIRPGAIGQWDVYCDLRGEVGEAERAVLAGLTARDIVAMNYRLALEEAGVNTNDPDQIREYQRIQQMPEEEIEENLRQLERRLAD